MDAAKAFGRGISFPPRVGPDGRVAWSEGPENVRESIRIILSTELGERLRSPDFGAGLQAFLFEANAPGTWKRIEDRIRKALRRFEARLVVETIDVGVDPEDATAAIVTINYRLVATRTNDRVSLSLPLAGG
ncbi:MAG: GPW/gp25 family protein [Myxococcales bacterium]|nr:GPW/gp25 family protein [Myxococcales bacterium]